MVGVSVLVSCTTPETAQTGPTAQTAPIAEAAANSQSGLAYSIFRDHHSRDVGSTQRRLLPEVRRAVLLCVNRSRLRKACDLSKPYDFSRSGRYFPVLLPSFGPGLQAGAALARPQAIRIKPSALLPSYIRWPPPRASAFVRLDTGDALGARKSKISASTYGAYFDAVMEALARAGYVGTAISAIKQSDGFALVTPPERIDQNYVAITGKDRFVTGKIPVRGDRFSVIDHMKSLIVDEDQRYRAFVFAVLPRELTMRPAGATTSSVTDSVSKDSPESPASLAEATAPALNMYVLVYEFVRASGSNVATVIENSTIDAQLQLQQAGIVVELP